MGQDDLAGRERVLAALYDAAAAPEADAWAAAMGALTDHVGALGAELLIWDNARQTAALSIAPSFDPAGQEMYAREFGAIDPHRTLLGGRPPSDTPLFMEDAFGPEAVSADPFYQEFLIPVGGRFLAAAHLATTGSRSVFLGIHRTAAMGPFQADDRRRVIALMPHVRRAVDIGERLTGGQTGPASLADAALQALDQPVCLCDADGRLLFANAAAEAILRDALCPLGLRRGRLAADTPGEAERLRAALRQPEGGQALLAPGDPGAVAVVVVPLGEAVQATAAVTAPRLVLLGMPATQAPPDPPMLAALFGLTAAEAALAADLSAGRSLADIAEARGVRISTVRSQLSSILLKTGTDRQGSLVRLLTALPRRRRG